MLSNLTGWHFIVILFIVLLLFGAPKLPALARSLGQSMKILKSEIRTDPPASDTAAQDPAATDPTASHPTPAQPAAAQPAAAQAAAPHAATAQPTGADPAYPLDKPAS